MALVLSIVGCDKLKKTTNPAATSQSGGKNCTAETCDTGAATGEFGEIASGSDEPV